jgi:phage shock protein A
MGFMSKVRALTLGATHDLLDATIDLNSPSAVRQMVRDVEAALDKMKSEAAIQDGQLRTSQREKGDLETKIAAAKATITKLLASTNPKAPEVAKTTAAGVLHDQNRLGELTSLIASQQASADSMAQAVTALEAKHEQMVNRVRDLERLDRDTKAKESAAVAISNAGRVAGFADGPSIDDLQDRMSRRNDVASARFDQSMGSLHTETPDSSDVDALLESLKPAQAVAK